MRSFHVYWCSGQFPASVMKARCANAQSSVLLSTLTLAREIQEGSRSPEMGTVFHFETLTDFYTVVMFSQYSHHTRIDPSTRNEFVGENS